MSVSETWKPCVIDPNYWVSDLGRVASLMSGKFRLRIPQSNTDGYLHVVLWSKRFPGGKTQKVQKLVMESFVGPRPDGMVSCHNDGDRKNNRLSNLRYDTQKSNINDRREHGTISVNKGDANGMAKLDEQKVREMKIIRKTTGVSHSKLGKQYGVSREQARDICNGKCWAHVSI